MPVASLLKAAFDKNAVSFKEEFEREMRNRISSLIEQKKEEMDDEYEDDEEELEEAKRTLIKDSGIEVTTDDGYIEVTHNGKVIMTGDFDLNADGWFLADAKEKGKGQKLFKSKKAIIDYVKKTYLNEEDDYEMDNDEEELEEAKMTDEEVLKVANRLKYHAKNVETRSFARGLISYHKKHGSFSPDQVSALQNIIKQSPWQMAKAKKKS